MLSSIKNGVSRTLGTEQPIVTNQSKHLLRTLYLDPFIGALIKSVTA